MLIFLKVSRDSQKNIIIGKGGLKIKQVGMLARGKLEKVQYCVIHNPAAILILCAMDLFPSHLVRVD